MRQHVSSSIRLTGEDPQLMRLADEMTERLETGQPLDINAFIALHPAHEHELRRLYPAIQALVGLGIDDAIPDSTSSPSEASIDRALGDFRIVREIGRGGMGVVYEAEQLSIGRRVALKVLPFAAMLDKQQLNRFKNEARAAGTLDHPNIVAVHSVGTERGVHYYAMQLIEGQSLAELIADLHRAQGSATDKADIGDGHAITFAAKGLQAPLTDGPPLSADQPPSEPLASPSTDTKPDVQAALSTVPKFDTQAYFRSVAQLGIQAAQALHHAHQNGIIHRDVKPGNLLVDADGKLWVTDFGLARIEADVGMTMTGDLLGTLRYMSPEQMSGQPVLLDSRTDIYSLGVTLYELLTLRPAFGAMDRQKLLQQVAEFDPRPLCQVNRAIPKDLETILLKAMSKNAADRYAQAADLAEDLRRFLNDLPIRARPPSLAAKLSKWTRRNRRLVSTVATSLLVAIGLITLFFWQQSTQARRVAANEAALRKNEAALRKTAESNLYVAQIRLAQEEWEDGNVANALAMLSNHIPGSGEPDLRNWEWHYLYSLCHKAVATLEGHRGSVNWLAWSPDGQRLATASSDATVKIWDSITRQETATLLGHNKPVDWVAWSPDGGRIYSHSASEAVRIWDSASGKSLGLLSADMPAWRAVSNHDGSRIITMHEMHDKEDKDLVKTWDAAGGHELSSWQAQLYRGPTELLPFPKDLLIASSNKWLVSGEFWPGHIHILNATTGGTLHRKATLNHGISSMAFSPDGLRLLTGGSQGQIKLWDPSSAVELLSIQGHDGEVRQTAWRPDAQQWVTVANDGKTKLWDATSGQEIRTLRGHTAQVKSVAWNTDGSLLATGDAAGAVKLWNPARSQESIVLAGRTLAVWSPDGTRLATGGQELGSEDLDSQVKRGKIDIYDTNSWKTVVTLEDEFFGRNKSADWSPNGRRLAMSIRWGIVKVWEIPTTRELFSVAAHPVGTRGVAWSPSGQWLATTGYDKLVKIWDVTSGDQVAELAGHSAKVNSVAWSPDGQSIASNSINREVKIWDVVTWRELRQLHPPSTDSDFNIGCSIAWSPSGDRLSAAMGSGWLIVWDIKTGREVMSVYAHVASVNCVSWSPDGRRLATGSSDRSVKIWDAANGRKLLTLLGHKHRLSGVRWSPDGRQLASGSRDGVRVWGPAKDEVHP